MPADWTLHGNEGSFRLGAYDRGKELVIDPPLIYSTYYGGTGLDYAYAVAVDSIGNTYVAGGTGSAGFDIMGTEDAFVTKLRPNGSRLFTAFLGGGGADEAKGVAVDVQGNIYVTGSTGSLDFPTKGAIQAKTGGSGDAFLAKLSPGGAPLVYSTYLGGNANDSASAVAIDAAGNAYIVGTTFSTDFPTKNPFQGAKGAQQDAFVAKINPTGTRVGILHVPGREQRRRRQRHRSRRVRKCIRDRVHGLDELSAAVSFPQFQRRQRRRVRHETESRGLRAGLFHLSGRFRLRIMGRRLRWTRPAARMSRAS